MSGQAGPPQAARRGSWEEQCELLVHVCIASLLGEKRDPRRAEALVERHALSDLAGLSLPELRTELGLGAAAAERLAAAFALARHLQRERAPHRPPLRSPERVYECVWPELSGLEQECFVGLLLDGKHRLRRRERISHGTLTTSLVHPREVFRPAIRWAAAALVVVHNHPSGDPEPSVEDVEVTRRLRDAGRLLGIPLLDHVVCASEGFVSMRERLGF